MATTPILGKDLGWQRPGCCHRDLCTFAFAGSARSSASDSDFASVILVICSMLLALIQLLEGRLMKFVLLSVRPGWMDAGQQVDLHADH